jgi:DNA polymerase I
LKIIQTANLNYKEVLSPNTNDWVYNGLDCCVTLEICNELITQLDNTTRNTYEFSKELQGPVLSMSMFGLKVDKKKRAEVLAKYKSQMTLIADQLNAIIKEGIGLALNWRSPAQLKVLFYKVLGLPEVKKRNAHGIWTATVDRDALEHLDQYMMAEPLCIRLLVLRDLSKKVEFLETKIDSDGRMRCNFNIAGTKIGRLASSMNNFGTGRNMQNIDREERAIFIADEGKKFANLDLEQADARNLGAICWNNFANTHGEKFAASYLNACESSDLHVAVSKLVWPELKWTGDSVGDRLVAEKLFYRQDSYRQTSKKLGHATNYLESVRAAAKRMKMVQGIIQSFQKQYFEGFPCIPAYHQWVREQLKQSGQLTTMFGRRRMFHGRAYDETTVREAVAYSPASMTADEIDTGMIRLFKANKVDLLLQVHDSLLIQFDEDREEEIIPWAMEQLNIHFVLANDRPFVVPVDCKVGWNWGEYDENKNVDGLIKWKGQSDKRKRTPSFKLSVAQLLL